MRQAHDLADLFDAADETNVIWDAAFQQATTFLVFYGMGGRVGAGTRLVAWNAAGVGGPRHRAASTFDLDPRHRSRHW